MARISPQATGEMYKMKSIFAAAEEKTSAGKITSKCYKKQEKITNKARCCFSLPRGEKNERKRKCGKNKKPDQSKNVIKSKLKRVCLRS